MDKNPCESCKRAPCDYTTSGRPGCKVWRSWWLAKWRPIHNYWLKYGKK